MTKPHSIINGLNLKSKIMVHKCSPCGKEFADENGYLDHFCKSAGNEKPTSVAYLKNTTTPHADKISEAALKRGAEKTK